MLRLSVPMAAAQLALITMGLVDASILGHVSVTELGGLAMGRSISYSAMTVCMGVALALEPLASQAVGAGDPNLAWRALLSALKTGLALWLPVVVLAQLGAFTLEPIGVSHELAVRARAYMLGQAPGLAFYGAFLAGKTYLQAKDITRPTLIAAIVANLVNVVMCNLLVRGDDALALVHLPPVGLPRLGALGAGVATSIASLVLAATVLRAAWSVGDREGQPDAADVPVRTVLRLGLPIGLQLLAEIGVFTLVAIIAGRLGTVALSAHQVALGLASFTYMGALGISAATSVRVGQAVGAGESPRRAGFVGIGLGVVYMSISAGVFALVPGPLIRLFTDDPQVISLGIMLLRIAAVFQLFDGVQAIAAGALRGAGDVRFSFVTNVIAYWAIGLPIALALGFRVGWGAAGLWWGLTAGLVLVAFVLTARFYVLSRELVTRV